VHEARLLWRLEQLVENVAEPRFEHVQMTVNPSSWKRLSPNTNRTFRKPAKKGSGRLTTSLTRTASLRRDGAVNAIHDQRHPVAQLIGQPLADDPAENRLRHLLALEDIAIRPTLQTPISQRWAGERSTACRFNASATLWPRPIREHLPFPAEPPPRLPPLNWARVSGPPLALAAALIT
jgi:hypothetical protein